MKRQLIGFGLVILAMTLVAALAIQIAGKRMEARQIDRVHALYMDMKSAGAPVLVYSYSARSGVGQIRVTADLDNITEQILTTYHKDRSETAAPAVEVVLEKGGKLIRAV
jgi:hypothetical protein